MPTNTARRPRELAVTKALADLVREVEGTGGYTLRITLDRLTEAPGAGGLGYALAYRKPDGSFGTKSFLHAADALDWLAAREKPQPAPAA